MVGVSKPAIQQYEEDTISPSNKVLKKIAEALGVGVWYFFAGKQKRISLVDFRDGHTLFDEEIEKNIILDEVKSYAHKYIELITILKEKVPFENPIEDVEIKSFEDVEKAAKKVRKKWRVGDSPIDDVTTLLESKGLLILTVERPTQSQGVYGYIEDEGGNIPIIIVNIFRDEEVTRKRFTIIHELAHLFLKFSAQLTKDLQEQMCHYFASAMLLPEDAMISYIGKDRTSISLKELTYLKETYGISIQAIIYRAKNVGLINETTKRKWLDTYSSWYDSKKDFGTYDKSDERPRRFDNLIVRAVTEKRISKEKAVELTGIPLDQFDEIYNNKTLEL
jgi:Zn-dependent peptidase ImmA (M78 family)/DNA-binding XRE family transcriptional regulator